MSDQSEVQPAKKSKVEWIHKPKIYFEKLSSEVYFPRRSELNPKDVVVAGKYVLVENDHIILFTVPYDHTIDTFFSDYQYYCHYLLVKKDSDVKKLIKIASDRVLNLAEKLVFNKNEDVIISAVLPEYKPWMFTFASKYPLMVGINTAKKFVKDDDHHVGDMVELFEKLTKILE